MVGACPIAVAVEIASILTVPAVEVAMRDTVTNLPESSEVNTYVPEVALEIAEHVPGIMLLRAEIFVVQRYHCVLTNGVGWPTQVRPSFNVRVEPTEAVPLCVSVPLATGGEPIAAVADENALVAEMELVAVSRTRMYVDAWAMRSL